MSRMPICFILLLFTAVVQAACSSDSSASAAVPTGPVLTRLQRIVAIDISSSRDSVQLQEARAFVQSLIADLRNGDAVVFQQVYERGLSGGARQWSDSIPAPVNPARLEPSDLAQVKRVQRAAQAELPIFFDPKREGRLLGTDIIATLYRAADEVKATGGRQTTLYLVSDMLQYSSDLNLERGPAPTGWVEEHRKAGLLPDLRNVCVVVVGPDISTAKGLAVRSFWRAYFRAAGADLRDDNYRNSATSAVGLGC